MQFEHDDCLKIDGAGSDRGWIRLAHPADHPQWHELTESYREWILRSEPGTLNVGNWLDYERCQDRANDDGKTIHVCVYLFSFGPSGTYSQTIKTGWVSTIAEAKTLIETTITAHLARTVAA